MSDVVIIGGGVMGSATAYALRSADPTLQVVVVERDPTYRLASSSLSMANVRIQFSLAENIRISQYTMTVLERFAETMAIGDELPEVGFRREGNLFLVEEGSRATALECMALQRKLGCAVEWWTPAEVREHYPLYDPPERIVGATFGPDDGYLDAHAFLMGYRRKAQSLGASFLEQEVVGIEVAGGRATGVRLADDERLSCGRVVCCAGAWAADILQTAGVAIPVEPVTRQVFVLRPAVKLVEPLPFTSFPSGLYYRSETGGLLLAGRSLASDPVGYDFSWGEQRFIEHLWPELAELVPAFERLKIEGGWAGLYAVNRFDGNAILGEWPELRGLYLANGFSGHGLQQAPAVARYLSELITGRRPSLDLAALGPERLLEGKPLKEVGLV